MLLYILLLEHTETMIFLCSNAWPPLQHLVVSGLIKSGEDSAKLLGLNLVKKWVKINYIAFSQTNGTMFEKYDAEKVNTENTTNKFVFAIM